MDLYGRRMGEWVAAGFKLKRPAALTTPGLFVFDKNRCHNPAAASHKEFLTLLHVVETQIDLLNL